MKQRNALCEMFEESAASLSRFPKRAPELNDAYFPPHKYRKLLFAEHYLMVYQVAERKVFVEFIVDADRTMGGCFDEKSEESHEKRRPKGRLFRLWR